MRSDILNRRREIEIWVSEFRSKAFICRQLNCKPETLESYLVKFGINYNGNRGERFWKVPVNKRSVYDYLKLDGPLIKTHALRLKILKEGIKPYMCEGCKLGEWLGELIPLELHHRNGNPSDNRIENLQMLCPNCHALTPNHAGKGKRALVSQLAEEHGLEP